MQMPRNDDEAAVAEATGLLLDDAKEAGFGIDGDEYEVAVGSGLVILRVIRELDGGGRRQVARFRRIYRRDEDEG